MRFGHPRLRFVCFSAWDSGFQQAISRGTYGSPELQPAVPPVASEDIKMTAEIVDKHCASG